MKIIRGLLPMRAWAEKQRRRGLISGFVPTMGALHEGHVSLIRTARRRCDVVAVSLFVNPTQFGPDEDFRRYPRSPAADTALCRRERIDVLFMPSVEAVFPEGHDTRIGVGRIGQILEGASRPGHFSGVATVVAKLFQVTRPDFAFFGHKDYQQTLVIEQLARDLNFPVKIAVCPTVRERDGLAMSSRNRYLSIRERRAARVLFLALQEGRDRIRRGEKYAAAVRVAMTTMIRKEPLAEIDYVTVAHPRTLDPIRKIKGPVALLLAVRIGRTRLIDNLCVGR
jgi:pantoate--beta-alanine ligase